MNSGYQVEPFTIRDFKLKTAPSSRIALTREELQAFRSIQLHGKLKEAQDLFLWQCCTAMRYSDTQLLTKHNLKISLDQEICEYVPKKTPEKSPIAFPIPAEGLEILKRYDRERWVLPHIYLEHYNNMLKMIATAAGINLPVTIHKMVGNKQISETKKKCEVISSHTARHTFITLAMESDEYGNREKSVEWIMQWTGHTDFKMLSQYISNTRESKIRRISGIDKQQNQKSG